MLRSRSPSSKFSSRGGGKKKGGRGREEGAGCPIDPRYLPLAHKKKGGELRLHPTRVFSYAKGREGDEEVAGNSNLRPPFLSCKKHKGKKKKDTKNLLSAIGGKERGKKGGGGKEKEG